MKTALITGASSGIGRETALVFAENGYNLILAARRIEKLNELKEEILKSHQLRVEVIGIDLSPADAADKIYAAVMALDMKVDVLVNNAGYGLGGAFIEIDARKMEDMLMLNMVTLTKLTRHYAIDMKENGGGVIVNLASTAAFQPIPYMACYAATKAYVLHFTEGVAYEMKGTGVKLLAICPGATASEFAEVAGMGNSSMFKSVPTSRELAEFIYASLNTKRFFRIHGFKNRFLKSMSVIAPRKWAMSITAKMVSGK